MSTYIANSNGIFSEKFENESVIVNLNIGNYYNVRNIGSNIWESLQEGASISKLITDLAEFYKIDSTTITNDINNFVNLLKEEKLIIDHTNDNNYKIDLTTLPKDYTSPKLEVFSDLQEMFLLDPVHDADNKLGWPYKPGETK